MGLVRTMASKSASPKGEEVHTLGGGTAAAVGCPRRDGSDPDDPGYLTAHQQVDAAPIVDSQLRIEWERFPCSSSRTRLTASISAVSAFALLYWVDPAA